MNSTSENELSHTSFVQLTVDTDGKVIVHIIVRDKDISEEIVE